MSKPTDVVQFIADLEGGVFEQKLSAALSDVAAATIDNDSAGEVIVKFTTKRIGQSYMVNVSTELKYKRPTKNGGEATEKIRSATPMHVGTGGRMTLYPESQVPKGQQHLFVEPVDKGGDA